MKAKQLIEVLLVDASMTGLPEKGLLKSRNLLTVEMIWPRTGIARRSASRDCTFTRGKCGFADEPWAKRVLFREDVEGHTALAVSVSEPVSIQKLRRFLQLTAKYALKQGADFVEAAMVGYADIASAPVDALAAMVGEKDAPKTIAQGVLDIPDDLLPAPGSEVTVEVPLHRAKLLKKQIGTVRLLLKG